MPENDTAKHSKTDAFYDLWECYDDIVERFPNDLDIKVWAQKFAQAMKRLELV